MPYYPVPLCRCFFCENGRPHPAAHEHWFRTSDHLTVSGSDNPEHRVTMFACQTCGHTRPAKVSK